ncbi:MAG: hypothetical protein K5755_00020 [Clostridiales bacterium]|nr:hypothetical protein [Clostridiales bacterium]
MWQEGCHYETNELLEVFRLFAEEIIKRDLPVKLYGPESGELLGLTAEYIDALSKDETIMKVMPDIAVHSYHCDDKPGDRITFRKEIVEKYPSLRFDMSEWCELPNKSPTDSIKGALISARVIGQDLTLAGFESWTAWVAVNQMSIKDDGKNYADAWFAAENDFSEYIMAKRYFGMAHFSKYLPIGSYVLDTGNVPENENRLNVFSFITPDGKTVSVIVNEGDETELSLDGDYEKMQLISSDDSEQLKIIYQGDFKNLLTVNKNTLLTLILE